jgi:hypothetical protein
MLDLQTLYSSNQKHFNNISLIMLQQLVSAQIMDYSLRGGLIIEYATILTMFPAAFSDLPKH